MEHWGLPHFQNSCGCIDDFQSSDSDDGPASPASRQEMADIMDRAVQRQQDRLDSTRRVRANIEALNREVDTLHRIENSPPPYVTPPVSEITAHPNAPRSSPMRNAEVESERVTYRPDSSGQTFGRVQYARLPATERFTFTPVPGESTATSQPRPLPNPPAAFNDNS